MEVWGEDSPAAPLKAPLKAASARAFIPASGSGENRWQRGGVSDISMVLVRLLTVLSAVGGLTRVAGSSACRLYPEWAEGQKRARVRSAPAWPRTPGEVGDRWLAGRPHAGGGPMVVQSCTGEPRDTAGEFLSQTWLHVSYYTPDIRGVDRQAGPKAGFSLSSPLPSFLPFVGKS